MHFKYFIQAILRCWRCWGCFGKFTRSIRIDSHLDCARPRSLWEVRNPPMILVPTVGMNGTQMSLPGPTRTSGDVCFRAAANGIADMDRALIRSVSIYEVDALATPRDRRGACARSYDMVELGRVPTKAQMRAFGG